MATLKDVAQRAGVTVTTVSRMLNSRVRVSPETQARIQAAMQELGYYPNEMARSLARKNSSFIGLIVPSAQNYFFAELIHHIEAASESHGCKLLLCVSNQDAQKEQEYYQMLIGNKVMGVIMANYGQNFEAISRSKAPMVVFERPDNQQIPCAMTDDFQGGHLAGEHMIGKGCRHLLYLSGNAAKNNISKRRFDGLAAACAEHGLTQPALIEATWDEFVAMNYDASVSRIFQEYPNVDGVFTSNDIMAAGVVQYCRRHHISIPKKLKVVGYDDTSFAALCAMPLTTIHQPIEELARHAVECIIRRANGDAVPTTALFPVRLVERETT
ncbi:MAG: LacI family DNA-binding transcriptional regulator [Clostridia bacterium]|nr:LacI family DNA-binding transcriptional regulator [Clostridia bacterium]